MLDYPLRSPRFLLIAVCCIGVSGCGSLSGAGNKAASLISPYKMDVIQGNVVTREQLAILKPGMQRAQVRDVMGSSLLTSVFHADRWDYVFTLKRPGTEPQSRRVTVFFKGDLLDRIEADDLPSEAEFVSTLKSITTTGPLPALEASEEALKKLPVAAKPKQEPVTVPAESVAYPPLEPAAAK